MIKIFLKYRYLQLCDNTIIVLIRVQFLKDYNGYRAEIFNIH